MRLTTRKPRVDATANSPANWPTTSKIMLHVGCGPRTSGVLPPQFLTSEWHEVRLDINPDVEPDIVADLVDMRSVIPSRSVDGIWSSHNLEHVFAFQVPLALREFHRVLRPGRAAHVQVPDVLLPAKAAARGHLETELYKSPAGPVTALDMLFGFGEAIERGEHFMAHRTAFSEQTLRKKFIDCGFAEVSVVSRRGALWATGKRPV